MTATAESRVHPASLKGELPGWVRPMGRHKECIAVKRAGWVEGQSMPRERSWARVSRVDTWWTKMPPRDSHAGRRSRLSSMSTARRRVAWVGRGGEACLATQTKVAWPGSCVSRPGKILRSIVTNCSKSGKLPKLRKTD